MGTAWHRKYGEVQVLDISYNLAQIALERENVWVPRKDLLPERPLPIRERKAKEARELGQRLARVQDAFVAFLLSRFDEVEVYFRYDVHRRDLIERILLEVGAPAGLQHSPIQAGAHGGHTVPFGRIFELHFPLPESEFIIPRELFSSYKRISRHRGIIYNVDYSLELVKLYGFRLTNYKSFGKEAA